MASTGQLSSEHSKLLFGPSKLRQSIGITTTLSEFETRRNESPLSQKNVDVIRKPGSFQCKVEHEGVVAMGTEPAGYNQQGGITGAVSRHRSACVPDSSTVSNAPSAGHDVTHRGHTDGVILYDNKTNSAVTDNTIHDMLFAKPRRKRSAKQKPSDTGQNSAQKSASRIKTAQLRQPSTKASDMSQQSGHVQGTSTQHAEHAQRQKGQGMQASNSGTERSDKLKADNTPNSPGLQRKICNPQEVTIPNGELSQFAWKKFRPIAVKEVLHQILVENLQGKSYDGEVCTEWTKEISSQIKVKLKEMGYDRYKFVVQVVIGEQRGEGVKMGCRCFWDSDTDNYAQDIFMNESLFCVAAAFGVFYY